ncbi:MAG TPA: VOC family protein [Solirubrobacteraceae bacterium]|nr:VOC family protein [Solirubrobacteraceae bacterium]
MPSEALVTLRVMAEHARILTHVGLVVADIHAAVAWYTSVLGFVALAPPVELSADSHAGRVAAAIYGERFGSCRQAQLMAGNGVALELFEFVEPPTQPRGGEFEYWRAGFFHICVVDPDIHALAARIVQSGGRLRSEVLTLFEDAPNQLVYCEDPFGNVVEIFTHSHEQTFANRRPIAPPA